MHVSSYAEIARNYGCTGTPGGQHLWECRLGIAWSGKDWKSIGDSQPQYPRVRSRNPLLLCSEYLCASEGHVEMQSTVRQGQLSRSRSVPLGGLQTPWPCYPSTMEGTAERCHPGDREKPLPGADSTAILTLKAPVSGAKGMNVSWISHPL